MDPSFNLLTEPWLPCRTLAGEEIELPLEVALGRAHELEALRDPSPLVTAALHRLLLAVLHSTYRGPSSHEKWGELWEAGRVDMAEVGRYLDEWRDRFDLLSTTHPFFQIPNFSVPKAAPISKLATELACANNTTLFDHTCDSRAAAQPPAVAARWLVTSQAYALCGGQGATSNLYGKHPNLGEAPLVGSAVAFMQSRSLFETLLLNLVVYTAESPISGGLNDGPLWEQPIPQDLHPRAPRGYLDYLTWRSRCVRLLWEERNGEPRIFGVMLAQGERLTPDPERIDPMFFRRPSADGASTYNVRLAVDKALWRDTGSLFAHGSEGRHRPQVMREAHSRRDEDLIPADFPFRCAVLGMATDQARVDLWRHEELPVSTLLLTDPNCAERLQDALQTAEDVGRIIASAARQLASRLLRPADTGSPDPKQAKRAERMARSWGCESRFWAEMEPHFRGFLQELAGDREAAVGAWRRRLSRTAVQVFERNTQNCAGRTARELQARVAAQDLLWASLRKLGVPEGGPGQEAR